MEEKRETEREGHRQTFREEQIGLQSHAEEYMD
jgi:hypothetical protein